MANAKRWMLAAGLSLFAGCLKVESFGTYEDEGGAGSASSSGHLQGISGDVEYTYAAAGRLAGGTLTLTARGVTATSGVTFDWLIVDGPRTSVRKSGNTASIPLIVMNGELCGITVDLTIRSGDKVLAEGSYEYPGTSALITRELCSN